MARYDCGFGSDGTVLSYHCPHVAGKGDAMNTLRDRFNKGEPLTDLEVCVLNYGSGADAEQLAALEAVENSAAKWRDAIKSNSANWTQAGVKKIRLAGQEIWKALAALEKE
jgi:hypothetical protein